MKLITFQTTEAFKILKKDGILIASVDNIDMLKYSIPYDWIVSEMKKKKIYPQNGEQYPLWAWRKCGASIGPKRKKNINKETQNLVKITFEKPDKEVLLSDYMAYSFILSGHIVPKNKEEYTCFLTQMKQQNISLEDLKNFVRHKKTNPCVPIDKIQKTWERIFNLQSYIHQACIWNIKIDDVIDAEELKDPNYLYGTMNEKRKDGSRPNWKRIYLRFLK